MIITLDALKRGKSTVIKDNEYLSTWDYVESFVEQTSRFNAKYIINVEMPEQVTLSKSEKDVTYNKVWIQAINPNVDENGYSETYGLVYSLDVRTPIYKVYRGFFNTKNENILVWNKDWIQVYELKPKEKLIYSLQSLSEKTSNYLPIINKLKTKFIQQDDIHKNLGELLDKTLLYEFKELGGKVKLATSDIVKAYTAVYYQSTSPNYVGETENCSLLNFYDAIATTVRNGKDITNRWEKSYLISSLFNISNE